MASTTKIMTALLAVETGDLSENVRIPAEAAGIEGSSLYLQAGDEITLGDLVKGLLLQSANDAATAIALHLAGSVETFAEQMNARAARLGLKNTHFANPHGLDDPEHYTTAYDLAVIASEAIGNEIFRAICSSEKEEITVNGEKRILVNHNRLLRSYDGCIGVKTGYTKKDGRCLVSAAERDGLCLVAVTLNAPDDWNDHKTMLDAGFRQYERVVLCEAGEFILPVNCLGLSRDQIRVTNLDSLSLLALRGEHEVSYSIFLPWYRWTPVHIGQGIGYLQFYFDGKPAGKVPLFAANTAE